MEAVLKTSLFGQTVAWMSGGRLFVSRENQSDFRLPPPYQALADQQQSRASLPRLTEEEDGTKRRLSTQHENSGGAISRWIEPEVRVDGTILVGWYSSADMENPKNWPIGAKVMVYLQITVYTFVIYLSSSIISPAHEEFMGTFHVPNSVASLGLAIYVLGYGLGPMLFSPLSEIPQIGRNPPYLISLTIFVLLSVPCALVSSVPGFMVIRFLQGLFGSPCLATGAASIADITADVYIPYGLYIWAVATVAAPAIAPTIAGFSVPVKGWRWSMWEVLWASAACLLFMCFLPETFALKILHQRARRLRALRGGVCFKAPADVDVNTSSIGQQLRSALIIPWKINAQDPAILFSTVYIALLYAIFYSFFEVFPLVYHDIYEMNLGQQGLIFLTTVAGTLIVLPFYFAFVYYRIQRPWQRGQGPSITPERRLIPGLLGALLVPTGLLIFAWTSRPSIHWSVPTVGFLIETSGMTMVMQSIFGYIAMAYPAYAASVFAANDFARSTLAFAAILWAGPLYRRLGVARGTTLIAGLTGACVAGMYVFFFWGSSLRRRSRFASA
ncbi:MFS general substrate transporter [Aspergillus campestris IBT 28561]|uniref:MFS general substrate transporter n=1 Tax=Aspergillus campestris (strain IBT 28561) TaxID=1392248 RepID=A0A2I1D542_ASPC2|nr:MFS general substrate transporter [Aspergillus campestris IBT 28561]PKY04997.1 MFS general substrate transporter [Aspergillus campestris IBT 28561]